MWFKRKQKEPEALPAKKQGFFSTHNDDFIPGESAGARAIKMQALLAKTFQVWPDQLKPVDAQGKVMTKVDGTAYAMDEAYPNMQLVKLRNSTTGFLPEAQFAWYSSQGFIGYQTCAIIFQNWLVEKACSMPAKDSCRHGYELTINDGTKVKPEVLDFIRDKDKEFEIAKNCVEFVRMGRCFGIRIAIFNVDSPDKDYYFKPFNPDGIKPGSYKGITQVDPYWITPLLDGEAAANPGSMHFYEPTWWMLMGKRIHRTHLIIMRNGDLPDILKPSYLYGGIPVPQKVAERVYAAERTANEAPMLAMTKRLITMKTDITQAIANQSQFEARLGYWTQLMSNYGVKVIGEGDEIEQHDTTLSELDEVIMSQFQLVAAASGVPATKLLGTSPKGFNASGEYEESSYHEELESIQQHDLSPLVNRHHLLLIRSEVAPKFKIKPFNTEVNWKPTDSPTATELADLNAKKADTDSKLSAAGAIDSLDIRGRLIADPDSGYNGIDLIVPDGPGDRDAEAEAKEAALAASQENDDGEAPND